METDDFQSKMTQVEERFKMWSATLEMLASSENVSQLMRALEADDLKSLQALLEPTQVFQVGGCIDIVETLSHIVNFGPGHMEERCVVECPLFITSPSETEGKIYRMPDGAFMYVSERLWREYCSRAQQDSVWREQNKSFLKALGMLRCSWDWVPDDILISPERSRTLCFPTVTAPFDRNE